MICFQCGREITDDSLFCNYCGYKLKSEVEQTINGTMQKTDQYKMSETEDGFVIEGDILLQYVGEESVVTIPNNVIAIGRKAFEGSNVEHVRMGMGIKRIGVKAFGGCRKLQDVYLMKNIESIEEYAFEGCDSLSTIYIFSTNFKIAQTAFYRCYALENIVLNGNNLSTDSVCCFKGGVTDNLSVKKKNNTGKTLVSDNYKSYSKQTKKDDYEEIMNDPYTYEDYQRDLLLVLRDAPGAGSAKARIDHYEHGRDPYNLKRSGEITLWDKFITIVGWGIAIFILMIVISVTTGWF